MELAESRRAQKKAAKAAAKDEAEVAALGKMYLALVKGVIREAFDKDSDKVGDLGAGEVITALETRFNDDGQLRVQFERGWVSMTSGSGKELLEEVSAEEDC